MSIWARRRVAAAIHTAIRYVLLAPDRRAHARGIRPARLADVAGGSIGPEAGRAGGISYYFYRHTSVADRTAARRRAAPSPAAPAAPEAPSDIIIYF